MVKNSIYGSPPNCYKKCFVATFIHIYILLINYKC